MLLLNKKLSNEHKFKRFIFLFKKNIYEHRMQYKILKFFKIELKRFYFFNLRIYVFFFNLKIYNIYMFLLNKNIKNIKINILNYVHTFSLNKNIKYL